MKKLYFLIFTATLVCQAQAAQELLEPLASAEQDGGQAAAPLMLAIRHRAAEFYANSPENPNELPSTFFYGRNMQFSYQKQADDTYRRVNYSFWRDREEQAEPTAYRYEPSFDPKKERGYWDFVSIEKGEVTPAPEYEKPHHCVVQVLPETYYDEFSKYKKQADNTYKRFTWCKENKKWIEEKHVVCWCNRICKKDGTLVATRMMWDSRPAEKPENPEDGGAPEEETKEEHEDAIESRELADLAQLEENQD